MSKASDKLDAGYFLADTPERRRHRAIAAHGVSVDYGVASVVSPPI